MDDHKVDIYMPLYVRDFLTSTFGWSAEERGHYLTLLMVQWDRGTLPAGLEDLERLSPGVGTCWAALECKFPVCDDGARRNQSNAQAMLQAVLKQRFKQTAKQKSSLQRQRQPLPFGKRILTQHAREATTTSSESPDGQARNGHRSWPSGTQRQKPPSGLRWSHPTAGWTPLRALAGSRKPDWRSSGSRGASTSTSP